MFGFLTQRNRYFGFAEEIACVRREQNPIKRANKKGDVKKAPQEMAGWATDWYQLFDKLEDDFEKQKTDPAFVEALAHLQTIIENKVGGANFKTVFDGMTGGDQSGKLSYLPDDERVNRFRECMHPEVTPVHDADSKKAEAWLKRFA